MLKDNKSKKNNKFGIVCVLTYLCKQNFNPLMIMDKLKKDFASKLLKVKAIKRLPVDTISTLANTEAKLCGQRCGK